MTFLPTPQEAILKDAIQVFLKELDIYSYKFGEYHRKVEQCCTALSGAYSALDDYHKALDYELKALEINRRLYGNYHSEVASSFNRIGDIYQYLGNYQQALEYKKKALSINHQQFLNLRGSISQNLEDIISIQNESGNIQEEIKWELKLLDFRLKEVGEWSVLSNSYRALGYLYERVGDLSNALENHLKSLEIRLPHFSHESDQMELVFVVEDYLNIADVYDRLGDAKNAHNYYEDALKTTDDKQLLASAFYHRALDYKSMGETQMANTYLDRAFSFFLELGDLDSVNRVLEAGSNI